MVRIAGRRLAEIMTVTRHFRLTPGQPRGVSPPSRCRCVVRPRGTQARGPGLSPLIESTLPRNQPFARAGSCCALPVRWANRLRPELESGSRREHLRPGHEGLHVDEAGSDQSGGNVAVLLTNCTQLSFEKDVRFEATALPMNPVAHRRLEQSATGRSDGELPADRWRSSVCLEGETSNPNHDQAALRVATRNWLPEGSRKPKSTP